MAKYFIRITLVLALWLSVAAQLSLCQSAPVNKSASYKILIDGQPAGWERVEESHQTDGLVLKSSSEVTTGGQVQKLLTTTEFKNKRPVRYTVEITTDGRTQKYTINFERGRASVVIEYAGKSTERAARVDSEAVLLDKNVWHQYQMLLSKYDLVARGKQQFRVFIPQTGFRQFFAEVQLKEQTSINVRGEKKRANRFIINIADSFDILVIANESGVPLSIEVPSEDTKVIME